MQQLAGSNRGATYQILGCRCMAAPAGAAKLGAWLWHLALLASCSSYDASVLDERLRNGIRWNVDAAAQPEPDSGTEADAGAPVAESACGDGVVSLSEKCDIGIPADWPGACPTACPPLIDCVARELSGSNCQAECVVLAPLCMDGDGCCPADCTSLNDADCSRRCGDGVVQASEAETCEPQSAAAPCATAADCEDDDPCTEDVLVGSEANCNATCSHAAITNVVSGDGCCPSGANANSDGDCAPACGNGVREADEECDGGDDCDADCKRTLTPAQMACLSMIDEEIGNDCDHCSCMQCADARLDCVASGDATRDMHCAAIIQCANDEDCTGAACYCADSLCWYAGPCRGVIDAAAAADPSGASVEDQGDDPNTAIGRASALGRCKVASCSDVCP